MRSLLYKSPIEHDKALQNKQLRQWQEPIVYYVKQGCILQLNLLINIIKGTLSDDKSTTVIKQIFAAKDDSNCNCYHHCVLNLQLEIAQVIFPYATFEDLNEPGFMGFNTKQLVERWFGTNQEPTASAILDIINFRINELTLEQSFQQLNLNPSLIKDGVTTLEGDFEQLNLNAEQQGARQSYQQLTFSSSNTSFGKSHSF